MLLSGVVFPETYLLLANAEAELGGDALPTLEVGVLRYPDHPFLLIELAKACSAAGQADGRPRSPWPRTAVCPVMQA
jgi:hypothetical protein